MPQKKSKSKKRDLKDLAKNIVASYDARVKIVGEVINDTHKMMDDFKGKRESMSEGLRGALARNESLRKKDFDRMMADIITQQNKREAEVKKMLEDFHKEEEMVAEKLRNLLKKGEDVRIKDFKKMMTDIKAEQEARTRETSGAIADELEKMRGEVYAMLDNFKKERYSVAGAWQEILGLFHQEKSPAPFQSKRGTGQANPENPGEDAEDIKNNEDST